MALGAQPRSIVASLLRQSTQVAVIGLLLGIGMGVAMSSGVSSMLYGVRPVEPVILITVTGMTASIAVLTTYLAARQSLNIDPLEAVRHI